jgi:cytidylate kinase
MWDNHSVQRGITITIDGTAGSGKSTTAREVAQRLGYIYLDTGAMYRAVTLAALRAKVSPDDAASLSELMEETEVHIDGENRVWLNGEDVTRQIRDPQVDDLVSIVSAIPLVRSKLVAMQRKIGEEGGLVCEGRDIGTVVFPEAELKIYMDADLSERARRRQEELEEKNVSLSQQEVRKALLNRDKIDGSRSHSPLRVPQDAVVIDTTDLTKEEEIERVLEEARKRGV